MTQGGCTSVKQEHGGKHHRSQHRSYVVTDSQALDEPWMVGNTGMRRAQHQSAPDMRRTFATVFMFLLAMLLGELAQGTWHVFLRRSGLAVKPREKDLKEAIMVKHGLASSR